MVGIVILIIAVLLAPLVLMIAMRSSVGRRLDNLSKEVQALKNEIIKQRPKKDKPKPSVVPKPAVQEPERITLHPNIQDLVIDEKSKEEKPEEVIPKESKPTTIKEIAEHRLEKIAKEKKAKEQEQEQEKQKTIPKQAAMVAQKVESKKRSFADKNPDLEKFIGENLMNKIGIGILVIGIGFFVKYAIDMGWLNEVGRTIIGLLCGGILIGIAHKLKDNYKAFSSVLIGGGLGTFYFTIGIAFREYQLVSQTGAFAIMLIITAFSILMSLWYDKKELAILAILGGFASPLIASSGEGNYVVLFSYLLILDVGMLILAYFKKWNSVNVISYICTYLLFGAWFISDVLNVEGAPNIAAVLFGGAFFLIFFLSNIINNLKKHVQFNALELSLILSNTFIYFSIGLLSFGEILGGELRGVFTVLFALFNFGFAYAFYKRKSADVNLVYLLIGLVLTFLSLVAPVQLDGNHITLFWAAEAVLLLWLGQKSGIQIIKLSSVLINALLLISLVMDWES
ncbi:MAG: DUF2339 domain-containing protein, partial [Flavobacteriales bacterium]|nr:DUF2339 domain-containing protein [Flavobacteriales bacterium]